MFLIFFTVNGYFFVVFTPNRSLYLMFHGEQLTPPKPDNMSVIMLALSCVV